MKEKVLIPAKEDPVKLADEMKRAVFSDPIKLADKIKGNLTEEWLKVKYGKR